MPSIAATLGEVGLPAPVSELSARTWDAVIVGGGHNGLACAAYRSSTGSVKTPSLAIVQYLMLFGSIGIGLWMIIAGIVVEPPAALMEAINRSNARLSRLFGRPATA